MVTVILGTAAAAVLALLAESAHLWRLRRVGHLAFGPLRRPARWTLGIPLLRAAGAGLLAWGLLTLLLEVDPVVHRADGTQQEEKDRHLVLVLDVSPSMRLEDAGPSGDQSRLHRARDVLDSMFARVAAGRYKMSVVATYNGALPVVVDTDDIEVIHNVLSDLPMHFAFAAGPTKLFAGLEEAARIAGPWERDSATVVVVSDGDTIPPKGMPEMPPSVTGALVVGVGDPRTGSFINGRNSRQDVAALRQMALRLDGAYHDGNARHVATTVLQEVTGSTESSPLEKLTRREYALMATGVGALLLALLPLLLHLAGTRWQPGRPVARARPAAVPGRRAPARVGA